MHIDFLVEQFERSSGHDAIVWRGRAVSYRELLEELDRWRVFIGSENVPPGAVVSLEADFSPAAVALLLALVENSCTVVPLSSTVAALKPEFRRVAQVEVAVEIGAADEARLIRTGVVAEHPYYQTLRESGHPGLVLFSSGSTGKNKAAVHDFVPLLGKFRLRRHAWRTMTFLLFDHIGGVNTLLYTLSNGGCVVTVQDRSPEAVCAAIERFEVQMLPTSPTFLNLLLISEAYRKYDLSSLEVVTYGTEVMPESTLERFCELFPGVRLQQTYGLSEVGILRSKSKASNSLWVKIGGEDFETRVVDGLLEIRAESAMLGYLNAPSPWTDDGWFQSGDAVDVDGEFFRFLGRREEIINVGGEKVYPAEIESFLQRMEGVEEVTVNGEPNAITGQIVTAKVKLGTGESAREFRKRMREFCSDHLARFKVPQKVVIVDEALHSERFKKMRREQPRGST